MTDFRKVADRLRRAADELERDGIEMLRSCDPGLNALLYLYREACPAIAFGLRAHADALDAANV